MKALIFGINGQDGYYLTEICQQRQIKVIGVSRSPGNWIQGDVSNFSFVENLIKLKKPTYIFHLAAKSSTRHKTLFENHETIATGTLNILESVKRHSPASKVFITGSGVQFENKGKSISENDNFAATSPYAVARIHAAYAARYFRMLGLSIYMGYLFHHESPYRKPHHISKMVALAVQRIAKGSNEIIEIGDISVEKEWTFAGDIAKGIFTLIEQDDVFESVIGSGKTYSIENWLEQCFMVIGEDWHDHVHIRNSFLPEYKRLVSNPKTINSLGWFPSVGLSDLARIMVNYNSQEIL